MGDHMSESSEYESPWRVYLWLGAIFIALAIAGLVTVFIPEIQDEPVDDTQGVSPSLEENLEPE
jgi:hypothetical protein